MSKTARLDVILREWAYDLENTPPNRSLRVWVGHFHNHDHGITDFGDEPHECLGAIIVGSRIEDVGIALSAYRLSQDVTCTALALGIAERAFVVSHTEAKEQWLVQWSLDDYGRVTFVDVQPVTHFGSRRLMKITETRRRGRLSLIAAIELVQSILDRRTDA